MNILSAIWAWRWQGYGAIMAGLLYAPPSVTGLWYVKGALAAVFVLLGGHMGVQAVQYAKLRRGLPPQRLGVGFDPDADKSDKP